MSIWADIHRRSNGLQERREDILERIEYQAYLSYLKSLQKFMDECVVNFPPPSNKK